ncbi:hypothetical protein GBA63_01120 [Rubrobacter tropicus]|uniref:SbsA Ig-like domain-containing protein n=1 Tax=Rubrobacter tropicus TaxID=2653851 RepID=A0A6G8Q4M7_9ACTN|nr:chitobiase/beta-hexosaminidase C-terminal domain-containing protein [Rubrobacter tropicus]QIN81379.1 hypothetical protein GBA63_01120 [Rubrobacter tropicus]
MTYVREHDSSRGISVVRKAFLACFAALLAVLALAPQANAQAVINEPPQLPHEVVVFPQRDFVVADGYQDGQRLDFEVIRKDTGGNDVTVGTATGVVAGGLLEVNHPGGVCWTDQTPDILPGDRVVVTDPSGNGDAVTTANVTAEAAFINDTTGNIEVHGTAREADGSRIPIERLEQRIINPDLVDTSVGRRDIRATSDGAELGTISYDGETGNAWTATYSDLGDQAEQVAVAGQTRIMSWQATNAAGDRLGITIFEEDEIGGPGLGGCGAGASYGVADFGRDAINASNVGQALDVTGSAFDASAVTATLSDGTRTINANITQQPTPATGHQSWKGTFSAADVATLADGNLTASSTYTIQDIDEATQLPVERQIKGADKLILKDTVAPDAGGLTATPGAGTFTSPQNVKLQKPAGEDRLTEVYYTTNGSQPTLASRVFGEDIIVTDDQTIRARMVDAAGNQSGVNSFAYDINVGPDSTVDAPANVTPIDVPDAPNTGTINNPPQLPHDVTVFPSRDFVVADFYEPFTDLFFKVVRNGHVVGAAKGTTDAAGFLEVNHPGGVCWTGQTPDIKAGDEVIVTDAQGNGDAVSTSDVFATGAEEVGSTVVIHGTAADANGNPFPIERLEQRIINPDFRDAPGSTIGRRDIRATSDGAELGDISYDPVDPQDNPDGTRWTAVYTGLNAVERDLAVAGQTRIMGWQATNAAGDRLGITIFEVGELGGPGFGGCPAPTDFAVTGANRDAVNATNVSQGLQIDGLSNNASAVRVTLTDGSGNTASADAAITPSPGLTSPNAQVFKAAFTAGQLGGLDEGTLTASAAYTVPGEPDANGNPTTTTFDGVVNFEVLKDTVAPDANGITATPNANTGTNRYPTWQAIALEHGDAEGTGIRFTLNGNDPTPYSRLAESQIVLDARPEPYALKAIAVDKAGNKSAVRTFEFNIVDGIAPRQPGALDLAAASDTGLSNTDNVTNDATPTFGGTAEARSTVRLFELTGTDTLNQVGQATAGTNGSFSVTANTLSDGDHALLVTATDASGNESARSNVLNLTVDTAAPNTTITSGPTGTVNVTTASFGLSSSEPQGARFQCSLDGVAFAACTSPRNYTGLAPNRSHTFRAQTTDLAGNLEADPASRTWTIDTVRPTVTRTTPAAGARNVAPASNVTATFSEAMTADTVNGTTVRLVRNGTRVGATVNYSPATRVVTLNPNANLVRGATYTATIVGGANGVKDTAGNAMATGMSWSFRIAP